MSWKSTADVGPGACVRSYGLYMKSSGSTQLEERKAFTVKGTPEALDLLEEAIIAQGVGVTSEMVRTLIMIRVWVRVRVEGRTLAQGQLLDTSS